MIKVRLTDGAFVPKRAHEFDAGLDLCTPVDFIVPQQGSATIDTGVAVEIPEGYVGFLKSKSGLNVHMDLVGEGVIDSGYTGTIKVKLYNHGYTPHWFKRGNRIIQLVIVPCLLDECMEVDYFHGDRGDNGFGSTGR